MQVLPFQTCFKVLDIWFVWYRRVGEWRRPWRIGWVNSGFPMHGKHLFSATVIGFELLVTDWPGRGNSFFMLNGSRNPLFSILEEPLRRPSYFRQQSNGLQEKKGGHAGRTIALLVCIGFGQRPLRDSSFPVRMGGNRLVPGAEPCVPNFAGRKQGFRRPSLSQ